MFKPRYTYLLLFLGLLFFTTILSGCTQNKMDYYNETPSTDLSKEKVGTISIGSKEQNVLNEFGEPDFTEKIQRPQSTYLVYGKNRNNYDLDFRIVGGRVVRYFISSKKYKTEKKISIDSSKEDVIQAYGDNYYERTDTGSDVIGYFDKKNKINIEFSFDKFNKVIGIIVSKVIEMKKA